jgi:hypothetical protein
MLPARPWDKQPAGTKGVALRQQAALTLDNHEAARQQIFGHTDNAFRSRIPVATARAFGQGAPDRHSRPFEKFTSTASLADR